MAPPVKLIVNCAAVGARAYFDEARAWHAKADAETDPAAASMYRRNAETCRLAGRNGLLRAGLPDDENIEPETIVELTAEEIAEHEARGRAAQAAAAERLARECDRILQDTEWTTTLPPGKQAGDWAAYREAIANLPLTTLDPTAPAWPERPAASTRANRKETQ